MLNMKATDGNLGGHMLYYTQSQCCVCAPQIRICADNDAATMRDDLGRDWDGPFTAPTLGEARADALAAWQHVRGSNGLFRAKQADKLVEALEIFE